MIQPQYWKTSGTKERACRREKKGWRCFIIGLYKMEMMLVELIIYSYIT
jgi:hypothetical protein